MPRSDRTGTYYIDDISATAELVINLGKAPPPNTPATGAPTISGAAQVSETLTADTSGIADVDGLSGVTFSYQWVSNDGTTDTDIQAATDSTYTLLAADEGKTIKVRVSFTDDGGFDESLTSAPTDTVTPTPTPTPILTPAHLRPHPAGAGRDNRQAR